MRTLRLAFSLATAIAVLLTYAVTHVAACDLGDVRAAISERNAVAVAHATEHSRDRQSVTWHPAKDSCDAQLAGMLIDAGYGELAAPIIEDLFRKRTERFGPDDLHLAEVHDLATYLHWGADSLIGARVHRERAIAIRRSHIPGNAPALGENLYELGYIFYTQNEYGEAARVWKEALASLVAADDPDHETIVLCQSTLAEMKRLLGAHDESEKILRRAIARSESHLAESGDHAKLLNNLAMHFWDRDRYEEAELLLRDALRISEADSLVSKRRIANAYLNLGVLLRAQQKAEPADPLLRRALLLARSDDHPEPQDLVIFLVELGTHLSKEGRFTEAGALWAEAESTLAALDSPRPLYRGYVLRSAGLAHIKARAFAKAERSLTEARDVQTALLGLDHAEVALTLVALGRATQLQNRSVEADTTLARAITLFEAGREAGWLATLEEAEAHGYRAEIARERGDGPAEEAHLLAAVGVAEELRTKRGGSHRTAARFFAAQTNRYDRLVAIAIDSGDPLTAFRLAERARSRALRDQLLISGIDFRAGIPPAKRNELEATERKARAAINRAERAMNTHRAGWEGDDSAGRARADSIEKALAASVHQLEAITSEIRMSSPAWTRTHDERRDPDAADPDRIRDELLRDGECLLVYRIGPEASALFVIGTRPDTFVCYPLAINETALAALLLQRAMDEPGNGVGGATKNAASQTGHVVARTNSPTRGVAGAGPLAGGKPERDTAARRSSIDARFIELQAALIPPPVRALLRNASRAIIVPDGPLHLLPFEALAESAPDGTRHYWLDWGPVIQYAPSIPSLLTLTKRTKERAQQKGAVDSPFDLLTICDPAFANEQMESANEESRSNAPLTRLPGTAGESDAIVRAIGIARSKQFTREEATEANVKKWAPHARYLHLATHGIVDQSRSDLLAALALAPDAAGADDGMLHMFEVYDIPLTCEIAVLSACDTRLGEQIRGEGVFALARAFLVAGADRTIASLWQVSDASTSALMQHFFERVAADETAGRSPDFALALRDAKRAIRDEAAWSDPYFWAPFVLAGVRSGPLVR